MAPVDGSSASPVPDERPERNASPDPMPRVAPESISPWELPGTYAALKATVLALETAWEEGRLDWSLEDAEVASIIGPELMATYRRLAVAPVPATARVMNFRRDSLHALVNEAKEVLRTPRCRFPARRAAPAVGEVTTDPPVPPAAPLPRPPAVIADGPDGPCTLRFSQLAAAAFWGIGFDFEDPADGDHLAGRLLDHTRRRLASDIDALLTITRWLGRRPQAEVPKIVPDLPGRRFEQLMLDLINEEADLAHRAPLFEDFLQKTDLRVQLPGLGRPRGARVQVTQTIHTGKLDEKLAKIRNLSEFVILSPRSLALALGEQDGARLLSGPDRDRFWECLDTRPASVDELATRLKSILRGALRHAREDPRGPAAAVPAPVRLLVRAFVERDSYRTTVELRRRELREGKWTDTSPKVAILRGLGRPARPSPPPTPPAAGDAAGSDP